MRALLVDDDAVFLRALARALTRCEVLVTQAESREAAQFQLERDRYDALLLDVRLGASEADRSGLDIITASRAQSRSGTPLPSVALTGSSDREIVRAAYAAGAAACHTKQGVGPELLTRALGDAIHMASEPDALRAIAGRSAFAEALRARIRRFAPSRDPVLITGPAGSGKDLVARALHELSGRRGPLVTINLAGRQNDAMLRSDLFGHLAGAFTGAARERAGAFKNADGGTLFLDEIGDLPLESQGLLLRAVEAGAFAPLGATQESIGTARLVFATNADLTARVKAGTFREDLHSRIDALRVRLPGLDARRSDIPEIALRFAREEGVMIAADALAWLEDREYRANARTLRTQILRVAKATESAVLTRGDFIAEAVESDDRVGDEAESFDAEWRRRQYELVEAAVAKHGGNESAAAAALGMNRSRLRRIRAKGR